MSLLFLRTYPSCACRCQFTMVRCQKPFNNQAIQYIFAKIHNFFPRRRHRKHSHAFENKGPFHPLTHSLVYTLQAVSRKMYTLSRVWEKHSSCLSYLVGAILPVFSCCCFLRISSYPPLEGISFESDSRPVRSHAFVSLEKVCLWREARENSKRIRLQTQINRTNLLVITSKLSKVTLLTNRKMYTLRQVPLFSVESFLRLSLHL